MLISRFFALGLTIILCSSVANAQLNCGGSIKQENFADELKQLNKDLQANIIEYRKLETDKSAEANARRTVLKSEIQKQEKLFKELNSPLFPRTQITAYGAACMDRRWALKAKEVLMKRPELLGGHFHVWLDKTTRQPKASRDRPNLEWIAK
jgi:hypothetical protein